MGILFLVSCLANLGWIFAWHYEIVTLSLLLMLVLLVSLIGIYLGLGIGRSDARKSERYLVHLPFSVYLGWITVAVIANVTALLVDLGWNRFGLSEQFWTVLVIAAGVALAAVALLDRKDIFYALVVVWALIGILVKRLSVDVVPARGVVAAAAAGIFVLAAGILFRLAGRKTYFQ